VLDVAAITTLSLKNGASWHLLDRASLPAIAL
jgi:hypothetical protein